MYVRYKIILVDVISHKEVEGKPRWKKSCCRRAAVKFWV
jgi:hypothetical protein